MAAAGTIKRELGLGVPVLQAGMGGIATPILAAAVSNAGGGGIVGLYKLSAAQAREACLAVAARTSRPFGINCVPEVVSEAQLLAQLEAAFSLPGRTPFATFYGMPPASAVALALGAKAPVLIQVGTLAEGRRALALRADALIVQGTGAGGHLLGEQGLEALVAKFRDALPEARLVAAGGLAPTLAIPPRIARCCQAAMLGTAFVPSHESDGHPVFKARVIAAGADETEITDLFDIGWSGRRHRVLSNPVTRKGRDLASSFIGSAQISGRAFPIPRFSAAVPTSRTSGAIEEMALYCGTSCAGVDRALPAAAIVRGMDKNLSKSGLSAD